MNDGIHGKVPLVGVLCETSSTPLITLIRASLSAVPRYGVKRFCVVGIIAVAGGVEVSGAEVRGLRLEGVDDRAQALIIIVATLPHCHIATLPQQRLKHLL